MKYMLAEDAKPQVILLIAAAVLSVALFVISWYVPLVGYIVYPLQLFATFIHEGSHALVAFITAASIYLTISWRALRMKRPQLERFENLPFATATPPAHHDTDAAKPAA